MSEEPEFNRSHDQNTTEDSGFQLVQPHGYSSMDEGGHASNEVPKKRNKMKNMMKATLSATKKGIKKLAGTTSEDPMEQ